MTKHFTFPPSIQADLFNYLKPEQQEAIKAILRVLKKPAQEELCCSLLDYMEQDEATPPADLTLAAIYLYLTHEGLGEDMDKPIIKPLVSGKRSKQPQHLSEFVSSIFPNFKKFSSVF